MRKFSFFILLLLLPLMSSGLNMLGLAIIWFLFSLFLYYKRLLYIKLLLSDLLLLILLFLYGALSLILRHYEFHYLKLNTYIVTVIYILVVYFFISTLKDFDYEYIVKIFQYCLVIFSSLVLIQWIIYLSIDNYLDLNKIVSFGNSESRYTSNTFRALGLIRPTAFFTEPSNASAVISMLTFCYMFLIKKLDIYVILGFFCSILTLSTAGVLIGSLSLGILLIFNKSRSRSKLFKYVVTIFCIMIVFYMLSLSYDRVSSSSEYDMLATRSVVFNIVKGQDWYNHLLGNGIIILSEPIIIDGYLVHDYSFRDSGFFVNLYYSFGLVGFVLFVFWSRLKIKDNIQLIVFFVILQSKFDYLQPVFWLLMFTVSMFNSNTKRMNHNAIIRNDKRSY